jgi:hypothetical protein
MLMAVHYLYTVDFQCILFGRTAEVESYAGILVYKLTGLFADARLIIRARMQFMRDAAPSHINRHAM